MNDGIIEFTKKGFLNSVVSPAFLPFIGISRTERGLLSYIMKKISNKTNILLLIVSEYLRECMQLDVLVYLLV
jgi:hypothetical protein